MQQAKYNRASKLRISSVKLDSAGPRDLFRIQGWNSIPWKKAADDGPEHSLGLYYHDRNVNTEIRVGSRISSKDRSQIWKGQLLPTSRAQFS